MLEKEKKSRDYETIDVIDGTSIWDKIVRIAVTPVLQLE